MTLRTRLAILCDDVPLQESVADLCWHGARRKELDILCQELGESAWLQKVTLWAE